MFFIGTYNHSLDEKSRVILPSKLREKLGGTVYITLGLDKCLAVYPEETFENIAAKLSKISDYQSDNRGYKRTFFSNSYQCDVDKQGRIQLTKDSLDKCFIKKDVVIIGIDDHVEIWDREHYEEMSRTYKGEEYYSNLEEGIGKAMDVVEKILYMQLAKGEE